MNGILRTKALRFLVGCFVLLALPALAVDSATGGGGQPMVPGEESLLVGVNWIDHFDAYVTGSQMHLQGGWKGWDSSPAAGALTSSAQARSPLNSVDVFGGTDLVHEYTGYTTGTWTYTAWQYIPAGTTGNTYFILLNTYADGGPNNWSLQLCFNTTTNTVNDEAAGTCNNTSIVSIIYDQWVEIRVVIDLVADLQTVYYNGVQLVQDSWSNHASGGGLVNIGAVDLFANTATSVFYDDISLSNMDFSDGFESEDTSQWHTTVP